MPSQIINHYHTHTHTHTNEDVSIVSQTNEFYKQYFDLQACVYHNSPAKIKYNSFDEFEEYFSKKCNNVHLPLIKHALVALPGLPGDCPTLLSKPDQEHTRAYKKCQHTLQAWHASKFALGYNKDCLDGYNASKTSGISKTSISKTSIIDPRICTDPQRNLMHINEIYIRGY